MKILVLTLGLALVCGLQALDDNKGGDLLELSGVWYSIGLASDNESKIKGEGVYKMFVKNIKEDNGMLVGNFMKRENGKCVPFTLTGQVVDDVIIVQYDGMNKGYIKGKGRDYVIFVLYNYKNGKVTIWAELYGRTPDLTDEIKNLFVEICKEHGISKDQIVDLSKEDRC
ncbi:trichosurin-like [Monodelphis domestica]|uniref:trichosurin-like n=1 Tax=Monodelphis domestica TaxID=13616 RepID=UPI0024E21011|nr:trichosurin-like [Monodelphis domestica]